MTLGLRVEVRHRDAGAAASLRSTRCAGACFRSSRREPLRLRATTAPKEEGSSRSSSSGHRRPVAVVGADRLADTSHVHATNRIRRTLTPVADPLSLPKRQRTRCTSRTNAQAPHAPQRPSALTTSAHTPGKELDTTAPRQALSIEAPSLRSRFIGAARPSVRTTAEAQGQGCEAPSAARRALDAEGRRARPSLDRFNKHRACAAGSLVVVPTRERSDQAFGAVRASASAFHPFRTLTPRRGQQLHRGRGRRTDVTQSVGDGMRTCTDELGTSRRTSNTSR